MSGLTNNTNYCKLFYMETHKPIREFSFTNSGKTLLLKKLLYELVADGLPIVRRTFYNLEANGTLPKATRTMGKWRIFTREEANLRKYLIWKNYHGEKSAEEYKKKLSTF